MMVAFKRVYARTANAAFPIAKKLLLQKGIPDRDNRRFRHWFASLFAIHNFDRLLAFDVPWWTYRAIKKVEDHLVGRSNARVFEWGSGASTVWLAKRSAEVISIEHDAQWFGYLNSRLDQGNATVRLAPPTEINGPESAILSQKPGATNLDFSAYVDAIGKSDGLFDLIVIDGRARVACLKAATARLKPDGIVLFDNSGRKRYRDGIANSTLHSEHFFGLTPCLPYPDQSSILRHKN